MPSKTIPFMTRKLIGFIGMSKARKIPITHLVPNAILEVGLLEPPQNRITPEFIVSIVEKYGSTYRGKQNETTAIYNLFMRNDHVGRGPNQWMGTPHMDRHRCNGVRHNYGSAEQRGIMTDAEHKTRHIELHKNLDELLADFIIITGKTPSVTMLSEFLEWVHQQTINPVRRHET